MKTIKPNLFGLSEDQIAGLSAITGIKVEAETYPLLGKIYYANGTRFVEKEPVHKHLEFAYEWDSEGYLLRIYVGSKLHGPMLSWYDGGWTNLYSRGNYGKNCACGGNWSATNTRYATIGECLNYRNYMVGNIQQERAQMTEGPGILYALRGLES